MTVRRSRRSLILYSPRLGANLFLWLVGAHLMIRRRNPRRFRHVKIVLFERSKRPRGRGTLTFELSTWRTSPGSRHDRVGLKAFVRLKFGFGGAVDGEYLEKRAERAARREAQHQARREARRGAEDPLVRELRAAFAVPITDADEPTPSLSWRLEAPKEPT